MYKGYRAGNGYLPVKLETKPMTVEDMLVILEDNARLYPEFADLMPEQKKLICEMNILSGTAESFLSEGKLLAVGGIKYVGIGEAWMLPFSHIRDNLKLSLLRHTRKNFKRICNDKNLWRVFATSQVSENFLEHCGFEKIPTGHVWTKKE